MPEPTSWSEAKRIGAPHYRTGRPCKRGHLALRLASNGMCLECSRLKAERDRREQGERVRKSNAEYRARNPEVVRARKAAWYARTKAARVAVSKAWRADNPEKVLANNRNRAAKRRAIGGTHSAEDVEALYEKQRGRCAHSWCRCSLSDGYHVDHIQPLARGGSNDKTNIQLLCPPCNLSKHDSLPHEVAQRHGLLL